MSELPSSWVKTTVGELFQTIGGGTPSTGVPEFWKGTIPWISSADISGDHRLSITRFISEGALKASAANIAPAGSVIVVTRVGLGKVAIADVPLCFSQDHQALIIPDDLLDRRYVLHYMSTAVQTYKHIGRGTTVSGITKKQLLDTDFILPPRPEQSRIVAEIDQQFTRLDAATAALKRVQANLKRYRASVLKAACEGRLVPTEAELARKEGRDYEPADQLLQRILRERRTRWESDTLAKMIASGKPPKDDRWKQKYKEPAAPDTSALPKLPEGWCWASLSELSWACDYGTSNKCGYEGEGPPVLRIPNIQSGQIDFCDLKRAIRPMAVTEGDDLKPGDLLIIRTNGSKNLIGRCALIERSFERVTLHASYLIRFRTLTVGHWLRDIWDSSFNRSSIEALAATSAGQYNVSMTVLEKLAFPIPPLAEIERLRFKLTDGNLALRRAEAATDENLLRARSLRSGILSSAFAGQLTYQDSGDEPASALLERIRAEFASQLRRKLPRRRKEPVHV